MIFKRKRFVITKTVEHVVYTDEEVLDTVKTKREAIRYVEGYIKGTITATKNRTPLKGLSFIDAVPSKSEIKRHDICFCEDDDTRYYIGYRATR